MTNSSSISFCAARYELKSSARHCATSQHGPHDRRDARSSRGRSRRRCRAAPRRRSGRRTCPSGSRRRRRAFRVGTPRSANQRGDECERVPCSNAYAGCRRCRPRGGRRRPKSAMRGDKPTHRTPGRRRRPRRSVRVRDVPAVPKSHLDVGTVCKASVLYAASCDVPTVPRLRRCQKRRSEAQAHMMPPLSANCEVSTTRARSVAPSCWTCLDGQHTL